MKKYNLVALFILVLITISLSSYFYFLDIVYKDKVVKSDVQALYKLRENIKKPIVLYANTKVLKEKNEEYEEIIRDLNLDATSKVDDKSLKISGGLHNTYSYILMKKLLNIIKNDDVKVVNICIGSGCTHEPYGFSFVFRPYVLTFQ
ncbi:MAG: hypothetical protein U9N42_11260 [Campylobacterota bacterium]|nr:hypothetical protein [Campylobacterota bacterium]